MGERDVLDRQIDRLEHGFRGWTLSESVHAVRMLRAAAVAAGRMPTARIAAALGDALGREGRGVMLDAWLWSLREAAGLDGADERGGDALIATVGVRYAA